MILRKVPDRRIKAVVLDIDGCITPKEFGAPIDLQAFIKLQNLIKQADTDPYIPEIIINTGRDLAYASLISEILGGVRYIIYEMGAAFIKVSGSRMFNHINPLIGPRLLEEKKRFLKEFLREYPQYNDYLQAGKRYMITFLFKTESKVKGECMKDLSSFIDKHGFILDLDEGHNFINVLFRGVNKGSGLKFLHSVLSDIDFDEIVGIGDSDGDWNFMKFCGYKACPANASGLLKSKCDIIADETEATGVISILKTVIEYNRFFMQEVIVKNPSVKDRLKSIRAIVLGIHGTLSPKEFGKALDLNTLDRIRALCGGGPFVSGIIENKGVDALNTGQYPVLILNTGRDINYTALFAHLLNIYSFNICEMGAVAIAIRGVNLEVRKNPNIPADAIEYVKMFIEGFISQHPEYSSLMEFVKEYMITFQFEPESLLMEKFNKDLMEYIENSGLKDKLELEFGPNFINITGSHMNKGLGLDFILELYPGLRAENILAIGDTAKDWDYMGRCAITACPSDADIDLKNRCDILASLPGVKGTLEIIRWLLSGII